MCTYIHIYIYIYTHTIIYEYIHISDYTHSYIYIYIYAQLDMNIYLYIYICKCIYTYISKVYMCIYIQVARVPRLAANQLAICSQLLGFSKGGGRTDGGTEGRRDGELKAYEL